MSLIQSDDCAWKKKKKLFWLCICITSATERESFQNFRTKAVYCASELLRSWHLPTVCIRIFFFFLFLFYKCLDETVLRACDQLTFINSIARGQFFFLSFCFQLSQANLKLKKRERKREKRFE